MLDTLITALIQLTIVIVMLSVGLQLTAAQIITATANRRLLGKALLANILLIPLLATLLVRVLPLPPAEALGFLLMAIAPGAPLIPKFAEIARADLPFAVGLVFVLALLTVFSAPLTASLILPLNNAIQFDAPRMIIVLLVLQLLPLLLGLGLHRRWPGLSDRVVRPSVRLANLLVLVLIVLILARDFQALLGLSVVTIGAMLLLTGAMLAIGWWFGGPHPATRRTLSLGTSAQFGSLALLIADANFPGTSAPLAIVAFALLVLLINLIIAAIWHRTGQPAA